MRPHEHRQEIKARLKSEDREKLKTLVIKHGDRVKLTSVKLPERDGAFLVKKVKRIYIVDNGNHQVLTLGAKVG